MKQILFLLGLFFVCICSLNATVWVVEPGTAYSSPSKVASLVQDGDEVQIKSGNYPSDVCKWTANNLKITGVGKTMPVLDAQGNASGGKAIWVIAGNDVTVSFIEFTNCRVPDKNGAGIRVEGTNIAIEKCYFHHNEMGILAGDNPKSLIAITQCEFAYNGYGDGFSHNVYVNHVMQLSFAFNYSHHSKTGHELKSRAYLNFIYYNRLSDEDGTASRSIDLPNGGLSYVLGNLIEQGPNSENSNIIGYGMEGVTNPAPNNLFVLNNTIINNKGTGNFFQIKSGTDTFVCKNNILFGGGAFFGADEPRTLDTIKNFVWDKTKKSEFVNPDSFNYRIKPTSVAVGKAEAQTNNILILKNEYRHKAGFSFKTTKQLSIGAFEPDEKTDVEATEKYFKKYILILE